MGPERDEDRTVRLEHFDRVRMAFTKGTKVYFEAPLHYLFYTILLLTLIGLFFGKSFSWQYYAILVALSAVEIYKYFHPPVIVNPEKPKKKNVA